MSSTKGVRIVPASEGMEEAMARLRAGQLVALPTETVYGLGADATNPEAVERIFAAKGRPATNPLIVHIADATQAGQYAQGWSQTAEDLAATFWPGPLTLVLVKTDRIPSIVTAGGETVGLRVPQHPVALELLRRSGVPVAAPSANRSEEVSPTTAQHVADSLGAYTEDLLILDGGPCRVGLESTVLDLTDHPPRVLRPGLVTVKQLKALLGEVTLRRVAKGIARSPGQSVRHYAPRVPLVIMSQEDLLARRLKDTDGYIWFNLWPGAGPIPHVQLPVAPVLYIAGLYAALRTLEKSGVERIVVQEPPTGGVWTAVWDRLRRAATK